MTAALLLFKLLLLFTVSIIKKEKSRGVALYTTNEQLENTMKEIKHVL